MKAGGDQGKTSEQDVLVEPDVHFVTYDEEQPVEAVPINVDVLPASNANNPVQGGASSGGSGFPPSTGQPNMSDPHGGTGVECMLCGDTRLRRVSPGTNFSISLCGNTDIDIHDMTFVRDTKINLVSIRLCGNINFAVPKNTRVVVRRISLCGSKDIYVEQEPEMDPRNPPPKVTITILSLCGNVVVRSDPEEMQDAFGGGFNGMSR